MSMAHYNNSCKDVSPGCSNCIVMSQHSHVTLYEILSCVQICVFSLDGFESRMALELIGVGCINHAHATLTYNLGPIKKKKKKKNTYNLGQSRQAQQFQWRETEMWE